MRISDIVRRGKGTAGHWHVEKFDASGFEGYPATDTLVALYHYSTRMLVWDTESNLVYDWSIGHGSVSDQGGMNQAFRELGVSYRFDRDRRGGGARITNLNIDR